MSIRYCLEQDNDAHWYLIPAAKRAEWNAFLEIPSDDERSWDVPTYAEIIDGPHNLTFTDPK